MTGFEILIFYVIITYGLGIILALTNLLTNPYSSIWYALLCTFLAPIFVPLWIAEFIIINIRRLI